VANLKDIRNRIASVKKTRQITAAMKLVASVKLRAATHRALSAQPYKNKLASVLGRLGEKTGGDASHDLLKQPSEVKRVLLVVLTADKGLCGGFNNTLLRRTMGWIKAKRESGVEVRVRTFGRKGREFFKLRGIELDDSVIEYARTPKLDLVRPLAVHMVQGFTAGEYDEVYLGFNVFQNALMQVPTFSKVLPLSVEPGSESSEAGGVDYLYEPNPQTLLDTLLPLYLQTLLLQSFLETEAGELAARMNAMENATKNAGELIGNLTLQYNRARQAAITTEIIEIVAGAEAL
jgi:F-type H+-transporting ATPase subunit gamma